MKGIVGKGEKVYLERIKKYSNQTIIAHEDSPQEGFEYFASDEYRLSHGSGRPMLVDKFISGGVKTFFPMIKVFFKHMLKLMKETSKCFNDVEAYLDELEEKGYLEKQDFSLLETYPNTELWEELQSYAKEKWGVIIGFTELPQELIFKGKVVLFKYALVCIQEMSEEEIKKAPKLAAGEEVMRVYKELGLAVDDIARWLRNKHNIRCQSNHPLGGLTNTSPLAAKAGMGWQGCNGLLVTPQCGQRLRIAPIFIEEKLFDFTDNQDHVWIEDFCKSCHLCKKSCPVAAIYTEKIVSAVGIDGIGETRTCIDRHKCFPQFNKTLGCSICIKVCPFSQGAGSYDKIKASFEKKMKAK